MDGISLFSYFPARSPIHRFDPRLKIASLIGISITVFLVGPIGLAVVSLFIGLLFILSGYPLLKKPNRRQFRGIIVLALLILIGRTFFSGAEAAGGSPLFQDIPIGTREGFRAGITGAWRLILFASAGLLFTVTTSAGEIRDAVSSLGRRLPFLPAENLGLMMSLAVTFVPLIFSKAREISDVHNSRGIGVRRAPVRRITRFASHLMMEILQYTDEISDAMESRGYGGKRTEPEFAIRGGDVLKFGTAISLIALSICADKLILFP